MKSSNGQADPLAQATQTVAQELAGIKGLLVLLLLKSGAKQTEIAKALGVSQATVSTQFRLGKVSPVTAILMSPGDEN